MYLSSLKTLSFNIYIPCTFTFTSTSLPNYSERKELIIPRGAKQSKAKQMFWKGPQAGITVITSIHKVSYNLSFRTLIIPQKQNLSISDVSLSIQTWNFLNLNSFVLLIQKPLPFLGVEDKNLHMYTWQFIIPHNIKNEKPLYGYKEVLDILYFLAIFRSNCSRCLSFVCVV